MKILFFVKSKSVLFKNHKSGGIEILNFELSNYFKKKKLFVILSNKITNKILSTNWDVVISSNDAKIFDRITSVRRILWLHNKLQIEKAFRKKQLFPILKNKIETIFVSKYLEKNTSRIYSFYKRIVISNFLPKIFIQKKIKKKFSSKKIFVWSVQRDKGLNDVLDLWKNKIHLNHPEAEFHIFSIEAKNKKQFRKHNIFFHGRVNRSKLVNFYKKSTAMICLGYDETFCLNAIESMSMGVPVISLGKTSLNELIKNNKNGFIVKNLPKLGEVITKLINLDKNKTFKLASSTIKFSKKYDSKIIFAKWSNLLLN